MNESMLLQILRTLPHKNHRDHGSVILRGDILETYKHYSDLPKELLDTCLEKLEVQGAIEIFRMDDFITAVRLKKPE
ncbi:hypothetical protein M5X00_28395 [Paenibacillus alvei]|uniref:hypothetical protein n=1 Tax=Paenibacillus alvei TaxID=44250 RepID=UPI000288998D|nr:hypothetical protein [Paenibacillus alvei]EJW19937.1 hypothetical protein PAV_1c09250 [Paenibacillus alvei DSM 29]MCY9543915.1 hypothetical protein [Paenibacillus alvei]MCY9705573.1 hypothetical protein [Paenibacillus alvei]MCY9738365.1 hypothetical protein [Paenibacillus alvei]MCY9758148.1 hypothetical protein [Paenibacillus alvei]